MNHNWKAPNQVRKKMILLLLFISFYCTGMAQVKTLSLNEAILLAEKNNTTLQQQNYQTEAARQRLLFQQADFLPVLNIQTGISHANEASRIPVEFMSDTVLAKLGTENTMIARLELHQTVTDFGKTKHSVAATRYELDVQKTRYDQLLNNIIYNVKQEYYKALFYHKLDSLYTSLVPVNEKLVKINDERLKNGVVLSPEVLRTQVALQNLLAQKATAQNEWNKSHTHLSILIGSDNFAIPTKQAIPEITGSENLPGFYNDILNRALQRRQDIRVLELQQARQKELVTAATAQKWPNLLLYGDLSYFGPKAFGYYSNLSSRGLKNYNWRIGLTFSYTLFDGFRTKAQKKEAIALQNSYREATYNMKLEIGGQIRSLLNDLYNLIALLASNQLVYKQAKSNLDLLKASFENGTVSEQTFTEALIPKAYAEASVLETRLKMTQALLELEYLAGGTLPVSMYKHSNKRVQQ